MKNNIRDCPFCVIPQERICWESKDTIIIFDNYPISKGHALIIPKRHITSFFEASVDEQLSLIQTINVARDIIYKEHLPDGFNIGINDGIAAGQTIMHLHIHIIPRYYGDTPDPRGGVRWIFPDKAQYWK